MIFGIGSDIVDTKRIAKIHDGFGDAFLNKYFTKNEISDSLKKKNKANFFSKRFAAKESLVKALGTGFRDGISFIDIEIKNDHLGKPFFILSDNLEKTIVNLIGSNNYSIHLTISDEKNNAIAFVVIEK